MSHWRRAPADFVPLHDRSQLAQHFEAATRRDTIEAAIVKYLVKPGLGFAIAYGLSWLLHGRRRVAVFGSTPMDLKVYEGSLAAISTLTGTVVNDYIIQNSSLHDYQTLAEIEGFILPGGVSFLTSTGIGRFTTDLNSLPGGVWGNGLMMFLAAGIGNTAPDFVFSRLLNLERAT